MPSLWNVLSYSAGCCVAIHIRKCLHFLQNEDGSKQYTPVSYLAVGGFFFCSYKSKEAEFDKSDQELAFGFIKFFTE